MFFDKKRAGKQPALFFYLQFMSSAQSAHHFGFEPNKIIQCQLELD